MSELLTHATETNMFRLQNARISMAKVENRNEMKYVACIVWSVKLMQETTFTPWCLNSKQYTILLSSPTILQSIQNVRHNVKYVLSLIVMDKSQTHATMQLSV